MSKFETDKTWSDVINFIASKQKTDSDATKILSVIISHETPSIIMQKGYAITILCGKLIFNLSSNSISDTNEYTPEYWALHYPIALYDIDRNYDAQRNEIVRLGKKTIEYVSELFEMPLDDFIEILDEALDDYDRHLTTIKCS